MSKPSGERGSAADNILEAASLMIGEPQSLALEDFGERTFAEAASQAILCYQQLDLIEKQTEMAVRIIRAAVATSCTAPDSQEQQARLSAMASHFQGLAERVAEVRKAVGSLT